MVVTGGADGLSFADEQAVDVRAPVEAVWSALPGALEAAFGRPRARVLAALVGARDRPAGPFALRPGATLAGFRVKSCGPPGVLVLEGRHRFAEYALALHVADRIGGSRIRARTRARFPGLRGWLYRALVIGTGGHVLVTRRILRSIARRAEGAAAVQRSRSN